MNKIILFAALSVAIIFSAPKSRAAAYDIYVDKNSSSSTEDGTQENPYKTIAAAVTDANSKPSDQRKIFISNGIYEEEVVLDESVSLTGENKSATEINGHGKRRTIEINKTSTISNLKISEGKSGIYVDAGAGATIENCKITKTEEIGIEIEGSSTSNSEKVTVSDCDIYDNEGKGFYIKKRRILIEKNDVEKNDEEGIDIRAGVKGSIKKNNITKNGESGIELIVGSSDLKISSNKIKSNSASGISNQFYKESKKLGEIKIEKNSIRKNDNYGLQCASPSGGNSPKSYWTKSIELIRNIFSGNGKSLAGRCEFPLLAK